MAAHVFPPNALKMEKWHLEVSVRHCSNWSDGKWPFSITMQFRRTSLSAREAQPLFMTDEVQQLRNISPLVTCADDKWSCDRVQPVQVWDKVSFNSASPSGKTDDGHRSRKCRRLKHQSRLPGSVPARARAGMTKHRIWLFGSEVFLNRHRIHCTCRYFSPAFRKIKSHSAVK